VYQPSIAIVSTETRLKGLLARWGSKSAARFRLRAAQEFERLSADEDSVDALMQAQEFSDFDQYETEDANYAAALSRLRAEADLGLPVAMVPRSHLPSFDFRNSCLVIVLGPDGLVANTAKYVGSLPIIGVNPDVARIDGVLLPFEVQNVRPVVQKTLKNNARIRHVTMGEVTLNDGQRLLAFNDFFIGCRTHTSARYTLQIDRTSEAQSSSGVIVSTGAGSTGWLSSIFNMTSGVANWVGSQMRPSAAMQWEDRKLAWVVREPFISRQSQAHLVAGLLGEGDELKIESMMPERGIIFSDGIESDGIQFNSGSIASIRVAEQCARLVVPS
jgi:NAD kinase